MVSALGFRGPTSLSSLPGTRSSDSSAWRLPRRVTKSKKTLIQMAATGICGLSLGSPRERSCVLKQKIFSM
jgi:hypothetical protein